ncbi:Calcium-dependent protein kinase 2 [Orchesella cincta]|uniref:Calcium-dependent protein kinase 2 n=1 Tax=Orchesella cincta TaxID=48709 RepID=A0A1D2MDH0_ORCCI|nr:Calcium-dependent protein kinase 2 [Orchesella cincta]
MKVASQCCRINLFTNFCRDGAKGTPCCGVRDCNIFCCNCSEGGCRDGDHTVFKHYWNKLVSHVRGSRYARNIHDNSLSREQDEHEHDKNKDGFYDINEAHNILLSGSCGNYTEKVSHFAEKFNQMDKDNDGKLSYEEING